MKQVPDDTSRIHMSDQTDRSIKLSSLFDSLQFARFSLLLPFFSLPLPPFSQPPPPVRPLHHSISRCSRIAHLHRTGQLRTREKSRGRQWTEAVRRTARTNPTRMALRSTPQRMDEVRGWLIRPLRPSCLPFRLRSFFHPFPPRHPHHRSSATAAHSPAVAAARWSPPAAHRDVAHQRHQR